MRIYITRSKSASNATRRVVVRTGDAKLAVSSVPADTPTGHEFHYIFTALPIQRSSSSLRFEEIGSTELRGQWSCYYENQVTRFINLSFPDILHNLQTILRNLLFAKYFILVMCKML